MPATDDPELAARIEAAYATIPKAKKGGRGKAVEEERDVYEAAIERVREAYRRFDHVYVSFSGGKDSTAVLNLAIEAARIDDRLPVKVRFWDEEAIPYSVADYARRVLARPEVDLDWYCLPVMHRNSCDPDDPHWYPWAPEARDLWCRDLPDEAITEDRDCPSWWTFQGRPEARPSIPVCNSLLAVEMSGSVCALLGNRADESMRRRSHILRRANADAWITHQREFGAKNIFVAYPIYDWRTPDVWTAVRDRRWDYCDYYDLMEMLGVPQRHQRLGPPYADEPLAHLWTYKEIDPPLWDKLSRRVPGANTAAMYARTVIYGWGGAGEETGRSKPDGMTWEEAIASTIREKDPGIQRKVARWVGQFISLHYRKTTDPILDVPHPVTAISWPYLYRLALRGDTKERSEPPYTADREVFERRFLAYHAALAEQQKDADDDAGTAPRSPDLDAAGRADGEHVEPEPRRADGA